MEDKFRAGDYGYGHAKLALLDKLHDYFGPARKKFEELSKNPDEVMRILKEGADNARAEASKVVGRARKACGLA